MFSSKISMLVRRGQELLLMLKQDLPCETHSVADGLPAYTASPVFDDRFPRSTACYLVEHLRDQDPRATKRQLPVADLRVRHHIPLKCSSHRTPPIRYAHCSALNWRTGGPCPTAGYGRRASSWRRAACSARWRRAEVRSPRVRSRMPRTLSVVRRRPPVSASG